MVIYPRGARLPPRAHTKIKGCRKKKEPQVAPAYASSNRNCNCSTLHHDDNSNTLVASAKSSHLAQDSHSFIHAHVKNALFVCTQGAHKELVEEECFVHKAHVRNWLRKNGSNQHTPSTSMGCQCIAGGDVQYGMSMHRRNCCASASQRRCSILNAYAQAELLDGEASVRAKCLETRALKRHANERVWSTRRSLMKPRSNADHGGRGRSLGQRPRSAGSQRARC